MTPGSTGGAPRPAGQPVLVRIDHVQLCMPPGSQAEAQAEAFFGGLLGLTRVPKPPELALRGGCWFERGTVKIHLGADEAFSPARRAHPALVVDGLVGLVEVLEAAGHQVRRSDSVPGTPQWFVDDPFGNRIELVPA